VRATINLTANVAGMGFGIARRRHHPDPASIAITMRAIQHFPDVCSRPRFDDRPRVDLRVADRLSDLFVWMIRQVDARASPWPCTMSAAWLDYMMLAAMGVAGCSQLAAGPGHPTWAAKRPSGNGSSPRHCWASQRHPAISRPFHWLVGTSSAVGSRRQDGGVRR